MNRMDGKVCIVTGATQGLGAAIAHRLAAAGAEAIVITGRNMKRGDTVARAIADAYGLPVRFLRRFVPGRGLPARRHRNRPRVWSH